MVSVGNIARIVRDHGNGPWYGPPIIEGENSGPLPPAGMGYRRIRECSEPLQTIELKKELGNVLFSTIRWIDDLGLDVLECLDLAIEAQEKFARSGRPR
jgi:hypothetical protein